MMLIPCPYCGPRNVTEFSYGGDGSTRLPASPDAARERDPSDRVFLRENPRGEHVELWQHSAGCRRWIEVRRNTLTHDIHGSRPAGQAAA